MGRGLDGKGSGFREKGEPPKIPLEVGGRKLRGGGRIGKFTVVGLKKLTVVWLLFPDLAFVTG